MTLQEAEEIALERINLITKGRNYEVALERDLTIEKPYGWVFFYTTKRFLETRNPFDGLAGCGPVIVESSTGQVTTFGSADTVESQLAAFEESLPKRAR